MSIVKDTFNYIGDVGSYIVVNISEIIYSIIQVQDAAFIAFIATLIVILPINYILLKLAPVFSYKKLSFMVAGFSAFISNVDSKKFETFNEVLIATSDKTGAYAFIASVIYAVYLTFSNAYYEGLFGRFRD